MRLAISRVLQSAGLQRRGSRNCDLGGVQVLACGGCGRGVCLRPCLPVRRANPQVRDAALTAYPAEQEVSCRRLRALQKVCLDFRRGTIQEITERLRSARTDHLAGYGWIGKRFGGRAIEA